VTAGIPRNPHFREFLAEKKSRDPGEIFTSDWYRHHRDLFASAP
jgi:hypothetical protein